MGTFIVIRCARCLTAQNYPREGEPRDPFVCDACRAGFAPPTATPHPVVSRIPDENLAPAPGRGAIKRAPVPRQAGPQQIERAIAPEFQELLARVDPVEAARQAALLTSAVNPNERTLADAPEAPDDAVDAAPIRHAGDPAGSEESDG